ncbi:MAG TPA: Crp/Fnr family transcriptional regulator [Terriglobales bacterium]|nr:Crp/Fnr family transcriptional regulator [Terriglobales bacterium]
MGAPYGLQLVENCLICKLRSDNFFCALPREVLEAFEKIKFPTAYPRGAVLFIEGQSPRGIYMLCRGRVKLSVNSAEGKTLILKLVEPGEVLGLHACVSGSPYELTAETIQPAQVNFVKRDDFLKFLEQNGAACLQAAQHLSDNCHSAYDLIRSLGLSHSAGEKLARFLLELTADAENTREGARAKLGLTHEEIAQIIGTSRETVTRLLAEFKRKHYATLKGSTLLIHDRPALEKLIGA